MGQKGAGELNWSYDQMSWLDHKGQMVKMGQIGQMGQKCQDRSEESLDHYGLDGKWVNLKRELKRIMSVATGQKGKSWSEGTV